MGLKTGGRVKGWEGGLECHGHGTHTSAGGPTLACRAAVPPWGPQVEDVTDDGLVVKKTLEADENQFKKPNDGATVTVGGWAVDGRSTGGLRRHTHGFCRPAADLPLWVPPRPCHAASC